MKINVKSYLWLVFAGMIGLSSCKKEDENAPAPSLTFTLNGASSANFNAGETAEFKMELNSTIDFTSLKGTLSYTNTSNSTTTVTIKDANLSNAELDYTKNSDIQTNYKGTKIVKVALPSDAKRGQEWIISVTSANANGSTSSTFKGKIVNIWTAKLLGAQTNSAGAYFNSATGSVLQGSAASATPAGVDITYAAIGSPVAFPIILSYKQRATEGLSGVPGGAEESYFVETGLQPSDFLSESTSWNGLFSGAAISSTTPQRVQIALGKVYAYKNKAGKMGLIHIENIVSGTDGSVTINVKAEN